MGLVLAVVQLVYAYGPRCRGSDGPSQNAAIDVRGTLRTASPPPSSAWWATAARFGRARHNQLSATPPAPPPAKEAAHVALVNRDVERLFVGLTLRADSEGAEQFRTAVIIKLLEQSYCYTHTPAPEYHISRVITNSLGALLRLLLARAPPHLTGAFRKLQKACGLDIHVTPHPHPDRRPKDPNRPATHIIFHTGRFQRKLLEVGPPRVTADGKTLFIVTKPRLAPIRFRAAWRDKHVAARRRREDADLQPLPSPVAKKRPRNG